MSTAACARSCRRRRSEIFLEDQRPAQYVFDGQMQQKLSEIRANEVREKQKAANAA